MELIRHVKSSKGPIIHYRHEDAIIEHHLYNQRFYVRPRKKVKGNKQGRVCDRVNGYSTAEAAQEAYAAYARSVAEQKAQAQLEEEQQEQEEEALGEEEWDASGDGLAGMSIPPGALQPRFNIGGFQRWQQQQQLLAQLHEQQCFPGLHMQRGYNPAAQQVSAINLQASSQGRGFNMGYTPDAMNMPQGYPNNSNWPGCWQQQRHMPSLQFQGRPTGMQAPSAWQNGGQAVGGQHEN